MHARGTAEVLTWPSINHPALTGQGGGEGGGGGGGGGNAGGGVGDGNGQGGGDGGGVPTVHPLASAPADVPCAPHARLNIPIKYCLLAQENQKKAKTAKPLFYERSCRHHAAQTRTAAAAQTRTAVEDAAGAMRRRLKRQRPNEQAPYGAHSHCSERHCRLKHHSKRQTHHSAQTRTDLYGADQQQRKEWINFFVLYVHVYVVNACAGYRRGLDMAVHQPSRAHRARRQRRRRLQRRRPHGAPIGIRAS
jgi:hypothetical protein